jgi:hypothetical protein
MKYSKIRWAFYGLLCFLPLGASAFGAEEGTGKPIEIFIGGKRFDSLEGYRAEKFQETLKAERDNAEVQGMFDEALRAAKGPLDLKFDPAKLKTIRIQKPASEAPSKTLAVSDAVAPKDPFTHSYLILNKIGFDAGIRKSISEFAGTDVLYGQRVRAADLENVLSESLGNIQHPLLLISDQKKLRVMVLDPQSPDPDAPAP